MMAKHTVISICGLTIALTIAGAAMAEMPYRQMDFTKYVLHGGQSNYGARVEVALPMEIAEVDGMKVGFIHFIPVFVPFRYGLTSASSIMIKSNIYVTIAQSKYLARQDGISH